MTKKTSDATQTPAQGPKVHGIPSAQAPTFAELLNRASKAGQETTLEQKIVSRIQNFQVQPDQEMSAESLRLRGRCSISYRFSEDGSSTATKLDSASASVWLDVQIQAADPKDIHRVGDSKACCTLRSMSFPQYQKEGAAAFFLAQMLLLTGLVRELESLRGPRML